jgi:hypothetical protein
MGPGQAHCQMQAQTPPPYRPSPPPAASRVTVRGAPPDLNPFPSPPPQPMTTTLVRGLSGGCCSGMTTTSTRPPDDRAPRARGRAARRMHAGRSPLTMRAQRGSRPRPPRTARTRQGGGGGGEQLQPTIPTKTRWRKTTGPLQHRRPAQAPDASSWAEVTEQGQFWPVLLLHALLSQVRSVHFAGPVLPRSISEAMCERAFGCPSCLDERQHPRAWMK